MNTPQIAEKIAESEDIVCASEVHDIEVVIKYLLESKN